MQRTMHRLGWKAVIGAADGADADSSSVGVAVLARSHLGLSSLSLEADGGWATSACSRWCVATRRLKHVIVTFVPVYLVSGGGLNGKNMRILSQLGARISQVAGPVVIIGDWQNAVDNLASVNFLGSLGLCEIPSDLVFTCA
eukprot:135806-Pyramimonas_sp.AAC.1